MNSYRYKIQQLTLILFTLFAGSLLSSAYAQGGDAEGKQLFVTKCQSCHAPDMLSDMTGPPLYTGIQEWTDKGKLHEWIKNNVKLTASGYPLAVEVSKKKPTQMQVFDDLNDKQIDAILTYINDKGSGKLDAAKGAEGGAAAGAEAKEGGSEISLAYGLISLLLALVAVILLFVNKNLKQIANTAEGVKNAGNVPFYRNKVYLAIAAIAFFIISGYFNTKVLIHINRQQAYEPKQPIFYSHKVHAGLNQINCLYCHGNAWESKAAAIPSVNVCMNCHKTIQKYNGPELKDANGNVVDGTAEIAKLYEYAAFNPANADAWDPSKAKPVNWVKIHNLPDHVYFNHSQHVRVGKVQCQTCHGEITAMDEVKQFAPLSMGWCVNCHRETNVNFNYDSTGGNKFYSIYEKFHEDIKAGKMDSVKVKDIGGLECQKCHY